MRLSRKLWAAFLLVIGILSGCWDRREIEEQANSLATGVDICAQGEGCQLVATRQFAIPGRIPLGGGGEGGGPVAETVFVLSSPGRDGPDTAAQAQAELHRRIAFGHTRVLVFSEAFARRGLREYLDYVRRIPEARRLGWLAVAEGRAEAVLRARPRLELVPALFLNDMIEDAVKTGRLPAVFLGEFLTRSASAGEAAVLPLIRMVAPDQPQLAGLAVFRGYRMVGKLSPEETETLLEVWGRSPAAEERYVLLPDGRRVVLRVFRRFARHRLRWIDGQIHVHVRMELESELLQGPVPLGWPERRRMVEEAAAAAVTRRAQALVRKLQVEFGADILGLGERVRAYLPEVWQAMDDWPAAFAGARFHFETEVRVRRTGMAWD